jgi:hypothetical protein
MCLLKRSNQLLIVSIRKHEEFVKGKFDKSHISCYHKDMKKQVIQIIQTGHHHARLIRKGRWTQERYDDGSAVTGSIVLGRFDNWNFTTREMTILESNGRPFTYFGRIPPAERFIEVAVEQAAPAKIANMIAVFVREIDTQHRRVELKHDDETVKQVERTLLIRWRFWAWVQRAAIWKRFSADAATQAGLVAR